MTDSSIDYKFHSLELTFPTYYKTNVVLVENSIGSLASELYPDVRFLCEHKQTYIKLAFML
jgi:hypothetical protein